MAVDGGQCPRPFPGQNTGLESGLNPTSFYHRLTQVFGVLSGNGLHKEEPLPDLRKGESTQTILPQTSQLDLIRQVSQIIALDVVTSFGNSSPKKPPTCHCKTMRRAVREMSERHALVFKGMVNKLKPNEDNTFTTFVIVADELFRDGEVNWGRIVALFAFAAQIAEAHSNNTLSSHSSEPEVSQKEQIASFLGKYVASKLGKWILHHGGWDSFVEVFPEQGEFEQKLWKGLLFTVIGFGALASMVASR